MTQVARIIESIDNLQKVRRTDLLNIFSTVAERKKNININSHSIGGSLIFGISDGREPGQNFTSWRFQTTSQNITANYHEIWNNFGKGRYFLERSYFHLYTLVEEDFVEDEYILLHCDASEPDDTPHGIYKQSPHLHIEVAKDPICKAHLALYNGRVNEVLKSRSSFNQALKDSVEMLNSQILQAHV